MSSKSIARAREALIAADRLLRADTHSTYEGGAWPAWQRAAVAYHLALMPEDEVWRADPGQPALRTIEQIRDRAGKLEEASRAVHAFPLHDTDFDQYVQQSAAAGWFHEMFRAMYPPAFWRCLDAVKSGDRTGLADPAFPRGRSVVLPIRLCQGGSDPRRHSAGHDRSREGSPAQGRSPRGR